jgi:hypothetical protein
MFRLFAIAFTLAMLSPMRVSAADAPPPGHSTVRIVFVAALDQAGRGMGELDDNGNFVPMATAGDMIVPYDSIRPVSITIDGDFVGHALFGYDKVSPVFVLPSGKRKFTFACDGFETATHELRVLGTGSTQYLIVKLSAGVADTPAAVSQTQTDE